MLGIGFGVSNLFGASGNNLFGVNDEKDVLFDGRFCEFPRNGLLLGIGFGVSNLFAVAVGDSAILEDGFETTDICASDVLMLTDTENKINIIMVRILILIINN